MGIAVNFLRKRVKAQKDHGKDANDKLPPTIKNRFFFNKTIGHNYNTF